MSDTSPSLRLCTRRRSSEGLSPSAGMRCKCALQGDTGTEKRGGEDGLQLCLVGGLGGCGRSCHAALIGGLPLTFCSSDSEGAGDLCKCVLQGGGEGGREGGRESRRPKAAGAGSGRATGRIYDVGVFPPALPPSPQLCCDRHVRRQHFIPPSPTHAPRSYVVTGMFGVSMSYHRQLSHKSFRCPKVCVWAAIVVVWPGCPKVCMGGHCCCVAWMPQGV